MEVAMSVSPLHRVSFPGLLAAGLVATGLLLAGCSGTDDDSPPDPSLDPRGQAPVEVGAARADAAPLPEGAQARSLLGDVLFPPPLDPDLRAEREANLEEAIAERDADPDEPEGWIWVGRHQAYLGEYRDAIETFSQGWERFSGDARFLRHRGHRHLTLRDFDSAIADLARGIDEAGEAMGEIEPDGLPNPLGVPLTTLGFNLWYHRALAEYLKGDFETALASWRSTLEVSDNPDLQVATRYWLHLTLRQLGRDAEAMEAIAAIDSDTEVIENASYRDLILFFRGELDDETLLGDPEEGLAAVTTLYGVAAHHLLEEDEVEARARFQEILERPEQWPAFGYVAAEAEVARRGW
jgi:tetratricopeptide (TPR) repeat protein